jgi:hypothetical protein
MTENHHIFFASRSITLRGDLEPEVAGLIAPR